MCFCCLPPSPKSILGRSLLTGVAAAFAKDEEALRRYIIEERLPLFAGADPTPFSFRGPIGVAAAKGDANVFDGRIDLIESLIEVLYLSRDKETRHSSRSSSAARIRKFSSARSSEMVGEEGSASDGTELFKVEVPKGEQKNQKEN